MSSSLLTVSTPARTLADAPLIDCVFLRPPLKYVSYCICIWVLARALDVDVDL